MSKEIKILIELLKPRWPDVGSPREGGNSWVFPATEGGREIAIKVFRLTRNAGRYARFCEEVRAAAVLAGLDGIPPILESKLPDAPLANLEQAASIRELAWFSMPWYASSLTSSIGAPIDDGGVKVMLRFQKIVEIVSGIHAGGWAHRDLKPDNILISARGELAVADFGLSIDLSKGSADRHTPATEIVGAFSYRAPEYLRGRLDDADHRPGDLFSLGRILWAMLAGREPFGLTDYEFIGQRPSFVTKGLRDEFLLDHMVESTNRADPALRPTIDALREQIKIWFDEPRPGSPDAFVRKVKTTDEYRVMLDARALSARNLQAATDTLSGVMKELERLCVGWRRISAETGMGGARVQGCDSFSGEFGPDMPGFPVAMTRTGGLTGIRSYLNLGTTKYPSLDLSVMFEFDSNHAGRQKYAVIAGYMPIGVIPPNHKPVFNPDSALVPFSFDDSAAMPRLIEEIRKQFRWLDAILLGS